MSIYLFIWLHQVFVMACAIFSCGMWTLIGSVWESSSLSRDRTQVPCIGSTESWPLDQWEVPLFCLKKLLLWHFSPASPNPETKGTEILITGEFTALGQYGKMAVRSVREAEVGRSTPPCQQLVPTAAQWAEKRGDRKEGTVHRDHWWSVPDNSFVLKENY